MTKCAYDPTTADPCVSMHHCPECGEMVIAGIPHPDPIDSIPDEEWEALSKESKKECTNCTCCGVCRDKPEEQSAGEYTPKKVKHLEDWILKSVSQCPNCHSKNIEIVQDNGSRHNPADTDMELLCNECGISWAIMVFMEGD